MRRVIPFPRGRRALRSASVARCGVSAGGCGALRGFRTAVALFASFASFALLAPGEDERQIVVVRFIKLHLCLILFIVYLFLLKIYVIL